MRKKNTDLAAYYFHEGTNFEAYKYLGCHVEKTKKGTYKYTFRTWAPNSPYLAVVGDFCDWDEGIPMKRASDGGIWECTLESDKCYEGYKYKFKIATAYGCNLKGDPYAFYSEGGSGGASYICLDSEFEWEDEAWLEHRKKTVVTKNGSYLPYPINIYEMHLGSFMRKEDGGFLTYRELADELVPYVKYMGYTHVEFMPVTEFPFDGSWGYQVCGYYAPTSRFGTPDDFRYLVSRLHKAGVGIILDWVPAHFPKDAWGLYEFDGRPLYEYQGRDRMESHSWGTRFFDLGRQEVQSFLISSALYWFREFHIDGIRVDAVASMLYLDYDRMPGEWIPNVYGENKNLEATAFVRKLNSAIYERFSDVLMIAEESTAWPGVTRPVADGGLGFNMKWNMGWANDFYKYVSMDPVYRRYHHNALNFPIMYAFNENYILPISHDEVVHGKCSLIGKMHGDYEDKFRQFRASLVYMMTFPGKKMLFMGTEFAQFSEWNYKESLEWFMLDYEKHYETREFVASLNRFYLKSPELWERDFVSEGFEWIYPDASDGNFIAYRRYAIDGSELICIVSFSGADNKGLRIPVSDGRGYDFVFTTFGTGEPQAGLEVYEEENGRCIYVDVPRMSGVILKKSSDENKISLS